MQKASRKRTVSVRFNEAEFSLLQKLFDKSLDRSLGRYSRKVLLCKPVVVRSRCESLEDILKELGILRELLSTAIEVYSEQVKKTSDAPNAPLPGDLQEKIAQREKALFDCLATLRQYLIHTADKWLR